jgi:cell wall-associated NlpC family hydrolase
VNQAIYGQKNVVLNGKNMLASEYRNWGRSVPQSQVRAGDVIVGRNGAHVGIIGPDGKSIIHSSSSKYQVVSVPLSQAQYVFPSGFDFRRQE